jgi:hypothetical protein
VFYETTSIHHTLFYISVIDSFFQEPQVGLYWSDAFQKFKISKHKLDSAQNITVSKDPVHIGHCCTRQLLLLIHVTTIVPLTVLLQEPQVGPYWSDAFQKFKILKHKLDSAQNITVSKDPVHIGHCCT